MQGTIVVYLLLLMFHAMSESDAVLDTPDNHVLIQDLFDQINGLESHFDNIKGHFDTTYAKLEVELKKVKEDVVSIKDCPENSLKFEGSCYFMPLWRATWGGAQKICERMGGHLATSESAQENQAITNYLNTIWNTGVGNKLNKGSRYFWIGGHDIDKNHYWVWVNAKKLSYVTWASGNPANKGADQLQCLLMHTNGKWYNAYKCDTFKSFLCEKQL